MTATRTEPRVVSSVMSSDPIFIDRADSVREVARVFDTNEISGAPVVDALGRLIGVISKTDILHAAVVGPASSRPGTFLELFAEGLDSGTDLDPEDLGIAEEIMSSEPVSCRPDDLVSVVARRMATDCVHRVIVVDDEMRPIGVMTALDALREFPD